MSDFYKEAVQIPMLLAKLDEAKAVLALWIKHADTLPTFTEEELDRPPLQLLKVYLADVAKARDVLKP